MKRIVWFIPLLFSVAAAATELTYVGAKVLADHDEASLTPAEMEALHVAQGVAGGESFRACSPPTSVAEQTPFTVVMKLDESGKILHTWLDGTSAVAKCFHAAISTKTLNKPPYAPFYTSFAMSWQPPPQPPQETQ
jgi:hypothetical protein